MEIDLSVLRHCRHCDTTKPLREFPVQNEKKHSRSYWCSTCKNQTRRAKTADDKREIHSTLGNHCACCGTTIQEFLTIDHIQGDGAQHRRQLGRDNKSKRAGQYTMYRAIIKEGIPRDRYQLLCWNCNAAKYYNNGCPHQLEKAA